MEQNPDLEQLVVGAWAETVPELRVAVNDHFAGLAEEPFLSDDIDEDLWETQIGLLTDAHSDYDADDILLMSKVCYARAIAILEAQSNGAGRAELRHRSGHGSRCP